MGVLAIAPQAQIETRSCPLFLDVVRIFIARKTCAKIAMLMESSRNSPQEQFCRFELHGRACNWPAAKRHKAGAQLPPGCIALATAGG
jgi:hypothetical protein